MKLHATLLPNARAVATFVISGTMLACGDNREFVVEPPPPPVATHYAFALATDYASPGILSRVELIGHTVLPDVVSGVASSDPVLVALADQFVVVNRFGGDNVTIMNRDPLQLLAQVSTGAGSNPQDVARLGDAYYVPVFGGTGVALIDAAADYAVSAIDLSALDAFDDLPECYAALQTSDTEVIVVCQLLENFAAVKPGVVVRLSAGAAPVTEALAAINPNTSLVKTPAASYFDGKLLVGASPNFLVPTEGCGRAIDPSTLANECVIDNEDLGGAAIRMMISADEQTLWMAVNRTTSFESPSSVLLPIDLATGAIGAAISDEAQIITDVATCSDGHVLATDSAAGNKGVRVYFGGAETTTTSLDLGLPPAYTNALACL
ncbi:MAG: hypothetical protein IPL79_12930 [Myxococcales bacterium]|nr:hypothetical protein [Myxococcales bacterium]